MCIAKQSECIILQAHRRCGHHICKVGSLFPFKILLLGLLVLRQKADRLMYLRLFVSDSHSSSLNGHHFNYQSTCNNSILLVAVSIPQQRQGG